MVRAVVQGGTKIEDRIAGHDARLERLLDPLGDGRDVLEPWLSLAGLVGSDERLDVGGGRDAAVVRDGVVEKGVGRVAGEGCEERADSFGLASTRRVVTKRFLDPA